MPRRSKSLEKYPEGRLFVLDFGESGEFADRTFEQALAGGGLRSPNKFIGPEDIPAGEQFSPEAALIAREESAAETWHVFRELELLKQAKMSAET
jgi:hypothetical protein